MPRLVQLDNFIGRYKKAVSIRVLLQMAHHPIFVTFVVAMSRRNRQRAQCWFA